MNTLPLFTRATTRDTAQLSTKSTLGQVSLACRYRRTTAIREGTAFAVAFGVGSRADAGCRVVRWERLIAVIAFELAKIVGVTHG
jgi:hypothetical protein